MTIEEADGWGTAAEQRWDLINSILKEHVPFPDEPFNPRSVNARVRIRPHVPYTRRTTLYPVAFIPNIHGFGMMGVISLIGGMSPYLYVDPSGRLMRESKGRFTRKNRRWCYVDDPFSITDEDIERLKMGVKGNNALIEAEYDKVRDAIIADLEHY